MRQRTADKDTGIRDTRIQDTGTDLDDAVGDEDDPLYLSDIPRSANIVSIAIQRASRMLRNDLNRMLLARGDLSLVDFRLLRHLNRSEVATQKELIKAAHMEQGQISRSLASLEKRGLVTSCAYPKDRRIRLFSMLPAGRAAFQAVRPTILRHNTQLTTFLSDDETDLILKSLRTIVTRSRRSTEDIEGAD